MRNGNKFFATITIVAGTFIAGMASQTAIAQQYYEPDGNYPGQYTPDVNAQRNNEIYGVDQRRARQLRRQLRRDRRARRARKRAARQRLFDVRQRENNKVNQGGYDYYGNPVPRSTQRPVRRARERVKLVYVPLPRAKPFRQSVVKVATKPAVPKVFIPTPERAPEQTPKKAVKIATLPKIEIETLPNPSAPKIFTPTAPKVTTPKAVVAVVPEKKIKYTTFADTLRKIRERNNAKKQQVAKTLPEEQPKAPAPTVTAPKVETPIITKPVAIVKEPTIEKPIVKKPTIKKIEVKKIAALTPKPIVKKADEEPRPAANQISCSKAKKIIVDYGFSDVKKITCKGKAYDFNAKRDGTPFKITLSSLSGELTKVLRQK